MSESETSRSSMPCYPGRRSDSGAFAVFLLMESKYECSHRGDEQTNSEAGDGVFSGKFWLQPVSGELESVSRWKTVLEWHNRCQ